MFYFKIAPSKYAFQNCYLSSIVIEGIRTLFSQILKRKKHKFNFKQK